MNKDNQPEKAGINFERVSEDVRRTILANSSLLSGKEVSIIQLKRGKAIGGCLHNQDEYFVVLDGCVLVSNGTENTVCMAPDSGIFYSGTPHAFYGTDDSIIIEWGISEEDKKDSKKDEEMELKVKEFNLLR